MLLALSNDLFAVFGDLLFIVAIDSLQEAGCWGCHASTKQYILREIKAKESVISFDEVRFAKGEDLGMDKCWCEKWAPKNDISWGTAVLMGHWFVGGRVPVVM